MSSFLDIWTSWDLTRQTLDYISWCSVNEWAGRHMEKRDVWPIFDTRAVKKCLGLPQRKERESLWVFWNGVGPLGGLRGERWETHTLLGGCQAMSSPSLAARLPVYSFVVPLSPLRSYYTSVNWITASETLCLVNQALCVSNCIRICLVSLHSLCWACQRVLEEEAVKPKWLMKSILLFWLFFFFWLFLSGSNSGAGVLAFGPGRSQCLELWYTLD